MAGAILEIVLTDALKVRPMPPWFTQCLQSVEVFVKIKHFFNVLAPAESVGSPSMYYATTCSSTMPLHAPTPQHTITGLEGSQQELRRRMVLSESNSHNSAWAAWLGTHTEGQSLLATMLLLEHLSITLVQVIVAQQLRLVVGQDFTECHRLGRTVTEQKGPWILSHGSWTSPPISKCSLDFTCRTFCDVNI